jgi:hypothetical protein
MNDDVSDPKEEYLRTTKSIETLSRLVQLTNEAKRKRYLQDEIERLTNYREQLLESFELDTDEIEIEETLSHEDSVMEDGGKHYPILFSLRDRFADRADEQGVKDPEIRNVIIYTLFFEEEYFPILDKKKLDLDHLTSLELESFFNLFNELKRHLEIFSSETEVIYQGQGATLKKIKAKQVLLVEVYKFFKRVRSFCNELLADIAGPQKICYNGNSRMRFSPHEMALSLSGSTVKQALETIRAFCEEVIDYLDIPSFKQ